MRPTTSSTHRRKSNHPTKRSAATTRSSSGSTETEFSVSMRPTTSLNQPTRSSAATMQSSPQSSSGSPERRQEARVSGTPTQRARHRPGARALMEIKKYRKLTDLLIQKDHFARLVREVCMDFTRGVPLQWQSMALMALQEAAEAFLTRLLEDSYLCSLHAKRVILFTDDLQLAQRIGGIQD